MKFEKKSINLKKIKNIKLIHNTGNKLLIFARELVETISKKIKYY